MSVILQAELLNEARGWLEDCFDDCPADLLPAEIVDGIRRHYDGGVSGFLRDSDPYPAELEGDGPGEDLFAHPDRVTAFGRRVVTVYTAADRLEAAMSSWTGCAGGCFSSGAELEAVGRYSDGGCVI